MPTLFEPTETAICNLALAAMGAARITSIDEGSARSAVLKERYPVVRDLVLRAYPWNCAGKRASLAASATAPAWGFARQFPLPTDFLALRSIYGVTTEKYTIENSDSGRMLLSDLAAPISILYTFRLTDVAQFDALLVDALAARLAADTAKAITDNRSDAESLWELYRAKIVEARRADAQEQPAEDFPETWHSQRTT